jgi:hypothetical protein
MKLLAILCVIGLQQFGGGGGSPDPHSKYIRRWAFWGFVAAAIGTAAVIYFGLRGH